jgi:hypothetical protein
LIESSTGISAAVTVMERSVEARMRGVKHRGPADNVRPLTEARAQALT